MKVKYSTLLNRFLAENKELTNKDKTKEVEKLERDDLFDLMRNVEELPTRYEQPVISAVASALLTKKIYLF